MTLPMMAVGAVGIISVAAHWAAPEMGEMIARLPARRRRSRRASSTRVLIESFDFETGDLTPNPIPAKAMMRALGQPGRPVPPAARSRTRRPRGPGPSSVHDRLRAS